MAGVELIEAMIAAVMPKVEARVYVGNARSYPFPERLEDARETCTPKGHRKQQWARELGRVAGGAHGAGESHPQTH